MAFNVIIFVCTLIVLVKHMKSRVKSSLWRTQNIGKKAKVVHMMFGVGGVTSLFGLTWLFATFTFKSSFKELRETFLLLFTVFNSLQGLFIFLFTCVMNKDARDEWKKAIVSGFARKTVSK